MTKKLFYKDDGKSVTFYETEGQMIEDQEGFFAFSIGWAIAGFLFFLFLGVAFFIGLHIGETWPSALRFTCITAMGIVGALIVGRLRNVILFALLAAIVGLVLWAIGRLIWAFL